jgi:hypothetical protein
VQCPLVQSGPLHWPFVTTGPGRLELVGADVDVLVELEPGGNIVEVAPPPPPPPGPDGHQAGAGGQVIGAEPLTGEGATTQSPCRDTSLPL